MFHLINTMYIFYLDIRPRKFKSVPHLMVIIMLSVLLFDTADNHQVLVSVNIYTIIVNVLVLLAWFGCKYRDRCFGCRYTQSYYSLQIYYSDFANIYSIGLFIREGPTFFMEKYPIPSLISGFIGTQPRQDLFPSIMRFLLLYISLGIGFSALGGYFYAQAQWTLLKQSSVDPNTSDQGFFTQVRTIALFSNQWYLTRH